MLNIIKVAELWKVINKIVIFRKLIREDYLVITVLQVSKEVLEIITDWLQIIISSVKIKKFIYIIRAHIIYIKAVNNQNQSQVITKILKAN